MSQSTLLIAIAAIIIGTAALASVLTNQTDTNQQFRYTQTSSSSFSPGVGHEAHQIVMVLPPNDGATYAGTLTYVTSTPVDIVVLHEIESKDSRGQPIWTVDDKVYGWTFIDASSSAGSFEYTGAGLILHTTGDEFVATVSVDGSVRGSQATITLPHVT